MSAAASPPAPSRLLPRDVLAVGCIGLRTRRLRAALSALGMAIGIASMVAVLGISRLEPGRPARPDRRARHEPADRPARASRSSAAGLRAARSAAAAAGALAGVQGAAAVYAVDGATVRRNSYVDERRRAASRSRRRPALPSALSATWPPGSFLDAATERFPTVVLGGVAAQRLGLSAVRGAPQVWIGDRYYRSSASSHRVTLDSGIDRAALIGLPEAEAHWEADGTPAKIYLRTDEDTARRRPQPAGRRRRTPRTPRRSRSRGPSDALEAKAAAEGAFTSLLLGLGAVALLVGGVGIANVMVISRPRAPLGDRAAAGARRHAPAHHVAVPDRVAAAGGHGRRGRGAARRGRHGRLLDGPGPADGRPARGGRGRDRRGARDRRDRRPVPLHARGEAVADRGAAHRVAARSVWVMAWSSRA